MAWLAASASLAPERQSASAKDTTPRSSPARPRNQTSASWLSRLARSFASRFAWPITRTRFPGYSRLDALMLHLLRSRLSSPLPVEHEAGAACIEGRTRREGARSRLPHDPGRERGDAEDPCAGVRDGREGPVLAVRVDRALELRAQAAAR